MRVRAVIVNFRTPDLTVAAARSVLADDPRCDLVVVDNASGDDSLDVLAREIGDVARIVASPTNLGFGAGVNLAARDADGDAIFVLNSDAVVVPGSLAALCGALDADSGLALAAPVVVTPTGAPQLDAFGEFPTLRTIMLRTNLAPSETLDPDWVSGVSFLVRRQAFEAIGGFDASYWMYFEDIDLCRRLRGAGWGLTRVPSATVEHLGGSSRQTSASRAKQYAASQRRYLTRAGYPRPVVELVSLLRVPLDRVRLNRSR